MPQERILFGCRQKTHGWMDRQTKYDVQNVALER